MMYWDLICNYIEKVLNILGGLSGIIILIIGIAKLFGKNLIAFWLAKDLEKYKAELDTKNKEIQNQLDIKLELTKLHESQLIAIRADSIKKIYQILANLNNTINILNMILRPTDWGTDQEIANQSQKIFFNFRQEWLSCKLFYDKELSDKIELFANNCYKNATQNMFNRNTIKTDNKILQEELSKLRKEATIELPSILQEIECSFRELVGIKDK